MNKSLGITLIVLSASFIGFFIGIYVSKPKQKEPTLQKPAIGEWIDVKIEDLSSKPPVRLIIYRVSASEFTFSVPEIEICVTATLFSQTDEYWAISSPTYDAVITPDHNAINITKRMTQDVLGYKLANK